MNTPRMITDQNGIIVWQWDNTEPFGNSIPNQSPNGTGNQFVFNLRYPGQYYDQETGTHYNYFRDYDPTTGRYLQSDPIGLDGGSFSTYAYTGANPLNRTDATGLYWSCKWSWWVSTCVWVDPTVDPTEQPLMPPSSGNSWPMSSASSSDSSDSSSKAEKHCTDNKDKDLCDKWYEQDVESCNNQYGNGLRGETFRSMLRGCLSHASTRRDRCYRGEPDLDPWTDDRSGIPSPTRRRN